MITEARDYRIKQEALWMEIDYYLDGQYNVMYDRAQHRVTVLPMPSTRGAVRRSVNLLRAKVRFVSNMVTKNEPAFNIRANYYPGMTEAQIKKAKGDAEALQAFCVSIWRKGSNRQKIRRLVRLGLKRGLAVLQTHWSDDLDDVDFMVDDPYNWLFDPLCGGDVQKGRYIIQQMVVSKKKLMDSGEYKNLDKVQTVKRLSPSDYRDSYLQSKYAASSSGDAIIINKIWEKEEVKGEEGEMECRVVCRYVSDGIEIKDKKVFDGMEDYPVYIYYPEINEGELYPRPVLADLIPLNKSVNNIMSYTEEYIATVGQGRYLKQKNTKITTQSTGRHGQIIEYDGATPPAPMGIPNIPYQVVQAHLSNIERFMSEIGGAQFLDVQQVIGSNMSGKAIGQLQAQQSESVGEPTENLSQTIKDVFEGLIMLARDNYIVSKTFPSIKGEDDRVYKIRGKSGVSDMATEDEYLDETIIDELPDIRVEIVPGAVFSELQRKQDVLELKQQGLVDNETVLDAYKVGSVREVIERMEAEQTRALEAQKKQQAETGSIQNKLEQEKRLTQTNDELNQQLAQAEGGMQLDPFMRALQNNPQDMTPEEPIEA